MSDELVTIATYPNALEAHVAKNYLEENGVVAFIAGENAANLQYPGLSESKLQVSAADVERSTKLLNETGSA